MFSNIEKNPRRAIILSSAFALLSVAMLVMTLQAPKAHETTFSDVFPDAASQEPQEAAMRALPDTLASGSVAASAPVPMTETERKLEVLKSLRSQ